MKNRLTKPFEWILQDRYRVLFHLIFWFVMYMDEWLSLVGITTPYEDWGIIFLPFLIDAALVYLNLYVLIPFLLLKGRLWAYVAATAVSILAVVGIEYQLFDLECEDCPVWEAWVFSLLIPTLTLLGTAIAVKIFKKYLRSQARLQELENTNLKTELSYLKNQINPHFLFNALNNIYVLSRKRPDETPESILLLSDLLRYQLYDCAKEKVALKDEIEYLKNYLKLDKLRKSNTTIEFDVKGDINRKMVAPFLFMPFVENAVKHGINPDGESFLSINFEVGKEIYFRVANSKSPHTGDKPVGGIGLVNVRRRLELLYPERHQLDIRDEANRFVVDLHLF